MYRGIADPTGPGVRQYLAYLKNSKRVWKEWRDKKEGEYISCHNVQSFS